jgi:hypothetical protein
MTVYYITALLIPSSNCFRPIHKYIQYFYDLAESGIPIGIYLDISLKEYTQTICKEYANVTILDYISIDTNFIPSNVIIPQNRNSKKDTVEYMAIQLMKLSLCAKAATDSRISSSHIAWIDFGIFHMITNKDMVKKFLLNYSPPIRCHKILNPGCWNKGNYNIWNSIAWRFCGSLLVGPRNSWTAAYTLQQKLVFENLPKLTWEVNYWTLMEDVFDWYKADHNDSIILNLPIS